MRCIVSSNLSPESGFIGTVTINAKRSEPIENKSVRKGYSSHYTLFVLLSRDLVLIMECTGVRTGMSNVMPYKAQP